ncbi:MAG: Gfo/Idh/MocA family oxidoreductase [Balneolaceae bacterium]|nr:Gfo/Idh/MocA family oxidoreductase [Balneolaceae bacterium]
MTTSRPIRVGFLGAGRISDLHAIEYLQNSSTEIAAVCDSNIEIANSQARKWGIESTTRTVSSIDDVLNDPTIDMVEILLPHHLHLSVARKAVESGKAVSLQKPMAVSLEEADKIVELSRNSSRPFKIFENFVFFPPALKAKELIDSGSIGDPITIRLKTNPGKGQHAWEVPVGAEKWRQNRAEAGGGPLVFDDGHHKFALAWFFMGRPTRVHSFIGETARGDGYLFDAPAMISFEFEGGTMGNLEVVYSPDLEVTGPYYPQDDRIEITGTKGVIWINCGHGYLGNPPSISLYRDGVVTDFHDIPRGWEQSFIKSTRHFIDVVANGGQPKLSAEEGREILKFALAAEKSGKTGKTIDLALERCSQ